MKDSKSFSAVADSTLFPRLAVAQMPIAPIFAKRQKSGFARRQKGFVQIVLILIFMQLSALAVQTSAMQQEKHYDAIRSMREIERVNFVRTEIEQNFDLLIKRVLSREITLNNYDPKILNPVIAFEISKFITSTEQLHKSNPEVKFYFCTRNSKKYSQMIYDENEHIDANPAAEILILGNISTLHPLPKTIKFTYSGFLLICAKISGENYSQIFVVPQGYTITRAGI
jgi:hypothetical protein